MHDPQGVSRSESIQNLQSDLHSLANGQRPLAAKLLVQRAPVQPLERDEGHAQLRDAEVEGSDHVGVIELPDQRCLALEPPPIVGVTCQTAMQQLERHLLTRGLVGGGVHRAKPAMPDPVVDPISTGNVVARNLGVLRHWTTVVHVGPWGMSRVTPDVTRGAQRSVVWVPSYLSRNSRGIVEAASAAA